MNVMVKLCANPTSAASSGTMFATSRAGLGEKTGSIASVLILCYRTGEPGILSFLSLCEINKLRAINTGRVSDSHRPLQKPEVAGTCNSNSVFPPALSIVYAQTAYLRRRSWRTQAFILGGGLSGMYLFMLAVCVIAKRL